MDRRARPDQRPEHAPAGGRAPGASGSRAVDPTGIPAGDDVTAELIAREPIFHRPAFGTTREAYLAQTAEDFWEVGASGRLYDRDVVIDELTRRGKVPGDEHWVVSEARCRPLGPDTYALTYRLDQAGRMTRRLTLWRRERDGWKILYHQGTLVEEP